MKRLKLAVEKRKILGSKVKSLRREGILPANIYGKKIKSQAVQLPYKEFEKAFKDVGETGLVDIQANGEAKPCLIHNVQYEPINRMPLHVDFYQVDLKEKVKTTVPIITIGEAKAVVDKLGLLLQPLSTIEVEALPEDLPEKIEVNIEHLGAVDDQITVGDMQVPQGVTILNDKSQVVVKIGELVSKEAQQQAAAEQAAAEAAKAATAEVAKPEEGKVAKPEGAEVGAKPEDKPDETPKAVPQAAKSKPDVTKPAPEATK